MKKSPLTREPLMTICEREFFPRRLRLRAASTKRQYGYAIKKFGEFLGHVPTPRDLDDDTLTAWLKALLETDIAVYTVREKLGRILTLWRWLACRRVVPEFPTVQRPEPPEIVPTALTEEQLRALFEECLYERHLIDGIRGGFWWQAFLAFVWSTSERKSAALALRWEWVDLSRKLIIVPAKVRKGGVKAGIYQLWDEVAALLARIRKPERELVFPWPWSQCCYYDHFARIARRAGIPDDRKHKTHALRVSHATWLKVLGGDPTRALMHGNSATTNKHYLDPRLMPTEERKLFVPWKPEVGESAKGMDWL